jgi:sporulation protein YlmC with PRC-barrel domain
MMSARLMNARALLGSPVHDRNGRELGSVEEIIVDRLTGRVSFAVVALNDVDSERSEYLPVPWGALAATSDDELSLQIPARRVADAPTIDADELDDLERRDVGVEVFSYFGLQPPWEGSRSG